VPALTPPASARPSLWFAFRGGDLLVELGSSGARVPTATRLEEIGVEAVRTQYLGALEGEPCFSAELLASAAAPAGHAFANLRSLHASLDADVFAVAGYASQIKEWDRTHQHCSACGAPIQSKLSERAKHCDACRLDFYPRVTPAAIVLVADGPRVLMTRQPRFPPGMYGLVAGFLEAGETLEACVAREVREETGLAIEQVRYFGSQPWPFPSQIMVGFFAEYAGGDLVVDHGELEDAQWFHRDALPGLPPKISIARALVEAWLATK
jgi:NAD+ diphosphatase